MANTWRVVVRGSPIFELSFQGLSWNCATELRDKMADDRRRVLIELDDEFSEMFDRAESSSTVLRRNQTLVAGHRAR